MTRDSNSRQEGEDSRSEAEGETRQSAAAKTADRPTSGMKRNELIEAAAVVIERELNARAIAVDPGTLEAVATSAFDTILSGLREPSEEMIEAGNIDLVCRRDCWLGSHRAHQCFTRMIDTLSGAPK